MVEKTLVLEVLKKNEKALEDLYKKLYKLQTGKDYKKDTDDDPIDPAGLSSNEVAFLELEKKYAPQITERTFKIEGIKDKLGKLESEITKVEERRANASGDDFYKINLHYSNLLEQREQVEKELDFAQMSDSDKQALNDFIEFKSGK